MEAEGKNEQEKGNARRLNGQIAVHEHQKSGMWGGISNVAAVDDVVR